MYIMLNYYLFMIMFLGALFLFLKYYHNVVMLLMMMEFMMLVNLMLLNFLGLFYLMNIYLVMYFLIFSVCESVLGLTLLILLLRSQGSDNVKFMSMVMW